MISSRIAFALIPLVPGFVTGHFEVWRLITYPFFIPASVHTLISSIINVAFTCMLIAFFGGELETIIHSKRFALALAITIVGGGVLFLLLDHSGVLAGPSMITMFVLGGFAYMWPKREISIFGIFWIKAWIIALVLFALAIIPMSGLSLDTSATNLFGPVAGALGAMIYLHVTFRQYAFGRAFLSRFDRERKRHAPTDDASVEHQIDLILDKISRSGMDSLSRDERDFLLRNSK